MAQQIAIVVDGDFNGAGLVQAKEADGTGQHVHGCNGHRFVGCHFHASNRVGAFQRFAAVGRDGTGRAQPGDQQSGQHQENHSTHGVTSNNRVL